MQFDIGRRMSVHITTVRLKVLVIHWYASWILMLGGCFWWWYLLFLLLNVWWMLKNVLESKNRSPYDDETTFSIITGNPYWFFDFYLIFLYPPIIVTFNHEVSSLFCFATTFKTIIVSPSPNRYPPKVGMPNPFIVKLWM